MNSLKQYIDRINKRGKAYFVALAQKQNNRMLDQLLQSEPSALRPKLTFSLILAGLLATLVHLTSTILLISALYILYTYHLTSLLSFFALLLLGIVWLIRPRFGKPPKEYLTRTEAPTLYNFVDVVSDAMNTKHIDYIVLSPIYNAAFALVGFRLKRVLYIGTSLWETLTLDERVALIGHELAHAVNEDSIRSRFIFTAYNTLMTWFSILRPEKLFPPGLLGIISIPLMFLYYGISHLARWAAIGLIFLRWNTSRRAEYLADYLASTVGGTQATRRMLGKLYYQKAFNFLSKTSQYNSPAEQQQRVEQLRSHINTTSLEGLEQINVPSDEEISRLDLTHPPIGYRMKLLKTHPALEPKLVLTPEQAEKIAAEIGTVLAREKRLLSVYDTEFEFKPSRSGN
ncbi:MAG: M48 family metalloprotease [Chloroflexota bacterium]